MGVRQHHVCDDSKVLAKYRLNDQDDFHSAIDYDIEWNYDDFAKILFTKTTLS